MVETLREMEGRRVGLALTDGSRVDDCQLVAVGRRSVDSVWIFHNGTDEFVPIEAISDVWESWRHMPAA